MNKLRRQWLERRAMTKPYILCCPRCGKHSFTKSDTKPVVNCGDCLWNDVEIVTMVATESEVTPLGQFEAGALRRDERGKK